MRARRAPAGARRVHTAGGPALRRARRTHRAGPVLRTGPAARTGAPGASVRRKPEARLHGEERIAASVERTEHVGDRGAVANRLIGRPILLPDEIEGAAGAPFPAKHEVAS